MIYSSPDDAQTIIIDNGSSLIKSGFAGDEAPSNVFPSIVGRYRYVKFLNGSFEEPYAGDIALAKAAVDVDKTNNILLKFPIEHGIVTNWDYMERIWHYAFYDKLRVDPTEHPLLITEHAENPKSDREKMAQIMFETFNIPSLYVGVDNVLSLYSVGRTTGIVCDIGGGVSHVMPIKDVKGSPSYLTGKDIRHNIGGRDLTNRFGELLNDRGYTFTTILEMETVREIKEKHSYVALDYEKELQKSYSTHNDDVSYTLPDGNIVKFSDEAFRCPELLFKPQMNGFQFDGVDKTIFDSIMKCENDIQKEMFSNIVLTGGCTMIKGFPERIEKELKLLAPQETKINVIAPQERKYAAWVGGSILASLATFPQMVITLNEYNENGPAIVHSKFF